MACALRVFVDSSTPTLVEVDIIGECCKFPIYCSNQVLHGLIRLLSMYVDLCSHSMYMDALRHWMWHHPTCFSFRAIELVSKVDANYVVLGASMVKWTKKVLLYTKTISFLALMLMLSSILSINSTFEVENFLYIPWILYLLEGIIT